jgi:hypothetical protein
MSTSITTQPTPDLESLRKAIQEFQPSPSRIPFNNLKPLHEAIVELRSKNASYAIIAELLIQNGVKTSVARVAEYGRIMVDGGKRRKRRKYARTTLPALQTEPTPPQPAPQINAPISFQPAPKPERGPRIARIRLRDGTIAGEKNSGQVS